MYWVGFGACLSALSAVCVGYVRSFILQPFGHKLRIDAPQITTMVGVLLKSTRREVLRFPSIMSGGGGQNAFLRDYMKSNMLSVVVVALVIHYRKYTITGDHS